MKRFTWVAPVVESSQWPAPIGCFRVCWGNIMTNVERRRRNLTDNEACPMCKDPKETVEHSLRDCREAKEVWRLVCPDVESDRDFWIRRFHTWLRLGLEGKSNHLNLREGNAISKRMIPARVSAWQAIRLGVMGCNLSREQKVSNCKPQWEVEWLCPEVGKVKLNSDGAVSLKLGLASAGGLIRDERGSWITGYMMNIGKVEALKAELWRMREGLRIARSLELERLEVEVDCLHLVQLVDKGFRKEHPLKLIVEECRRLRKANRCADHLAKLGAHAEGRVVLETPPISMMLLLRENEGEFVEGVSQEVGLSTAG
ncbi:Ribonuclease H domain [Dillenia turbinata]|uniref:Ribonuclease H domain n=1 Tax=Dillenia turbinata TaxID=194707 RepID=A0AAN8V3N8_9MAGN